MEESLIVSGSRVIVSRFCYGTENLYSVRINGEVAAQCVACGEVIDTIYEAMQTRKVPFTLPSWLPEQIEAL
jgi:hypothetical protein